MIKVDFVALGFNKTKAIICKTRKQFDTLVKMMDDAGLLSTSISSWERYWDSYKENTIVAPIFQSDGTAARGSYAVFVETAGRTVYTWEEFETMAGISTVNLDDIVNNIDKIIKDKEHESR